MSELITDEMVEAAAREWWQHSKAENDKFFGPLGVDPDPGWDEISEADREHVREDITRPHLEAVARLIAARAWSRGFNEAHTQHFQEDVRLSRRTPAIAYKNPYEEG